MSDKINIKGFEVFPDRPLEHLSSGEARAFEAINPNKPEQNLYALLCHPKSMARYGSFKSHQGLNPEGLTKFVNTQAIQWPGMASSEKELVLILGRPDGHKLMSSPIGQCDPWSEQNVISQLIKPLFKGLETLYSADLTHRSIRPDNIFYSADDGTASLGECFSHAPGQYQPSIFEPIEVALVDSNARGEGDITYDLHALGVSVVTLLSGGNPRPDLTPENLMISRYESGTFETLAGQKPYSPRLMELLRGLLVDDPERRWGMKGVTAWIAGERTPVIGNVNPKKARKSYLFAEDHYCMTPREVAVSIRRDPGKALETLTESKLPTWVLEEMQDKETSDYIAGLIKDAPLKSFSPTSGPAQKIFLSVAQALDPTGALSWKGMSYAVDGIGYGMANAVLGGQPLQTYSDLISSGALEDYSAMTPADLSHACLKKSTFRDLKSVLNSSGGGNGIERCLYAQNSDAPCLSPIVASQKVYNSKDLLVALEETAKRGGAKILDRHIAAFLAERDNSIEKSLLRKITHDDQKQQISASLKVIAILQKTYGIKELPNLAKWFGSAGEILLDQYKNQKKRKKLKEKLLDLIEKGSLMKLSQLLTNELDQKRDMVGFRMAKSEWALIKSEIKSIDEKILQNNNFSTMIGRRMAVAIATLLSATFCTLFLSYHVFS